MPVLADLLPNVNELFEWKSIFGGDTILAFNKTALMAFVSTLICVGIFVLGSRRRALVPTGMQNVAESGYEVIEQQHLAPGDRRRRGQEVDAVPRDPVLLDLLHQHLGGHPGDPVPGDVADRDPVVPRAPELGRRSSSSASCKQGPGYVWHAISPPGVPFALEVPRRADRVLLEVRRPALLAGGPTLRQHGRRPRAADDLRGHDERAAGRPQQRLYQIAVRSAAVPGPGRDDRLRDPRRACCRPTSSRSSPRSTSGSRSIPSTESQQASGNSTQRPAHPGRA